MYENDLGKVLKINPLVGYKLPENGLFIIKNGSSRIAQKLI